jgi:large subunit ribosomal protein L16
MILFANKNKFKKYQKLKHRMLGKEQRYILPKVGVFGLKFLGSIRLTTQQIEAVRKVIRRKMLKKIKEHVKISVFPDLPVTKKSSGVRMGKGKGNIDFWCFPVNIGRIVFELGDKIPKYNAYSCLLSGGKKLPFRCKVIINSKNN